MWSQRDNAEGRAGQKAGGARLCHHTFGFIAICAAVVLQMRRPTSTPLSSMAMNVVSTIEADITRNIEIYDLPAVGRGECAPRPDLQAHVARAAPAGPVRPFGDRRSILAPFRWSTTRAGDPRLAHRDARAADHSHTEHFRAHRDHEVDSPHISKAVARRRWRAIHQRQPPHDSGPADGKFAGMVGRPDSPQLFP